ncbi:DUF397 domain-containing protein [Streptomyces roseolus]|uniref:DUF397 domain-containing protein n=1 Tax=Streptomyces roseolus TaxID=67358 RepID=UPI00167567E0|nr:DUF397 domain-containing protein [Streptomyces roseolus]GGR14312.1 DUF397 domain-containing protein [Streptomyces roseolus]
MKVQILDLAWFKSSYSGGNNGESCVEVAATSAAVRVRDSKDIGLPQLVLSPEAWAGFVGFARHGG